MAEKIKKNGDSKDNNLDLLELAPPERTISYGESFLFRPDSCFVTLPDGRTAYPWIVGIPIYTKECAVDTDLPFTMIALALQEPCVALQDGAIVRVKKGETLVVTCTAALDIVKRMAEVPSDKGFVVWMRPKGKVEIKRGQSMWKWDVRIDPTLVAKPNLRFQLLPGEQLPAELQA